MHSCQGSLGLTMQPQGWHLASLVWFLIGDRVPISFVYLSHQDRPCEQESILENRTNKTCAGWAWQPIQEVGSRPSCPPDVPPLLLPLEVKAYGQNHWTSFILRIHTWTSHSD